MKQGDSSSNKEADKPAATASADEYEPTKEELEAEFREDDKGMSIG